MLNKSQIKLLLSQKPITDTWPWASSDDTLIDEHIKHIVTAVGSRTGLLDKTEYHHYGSGFSSFVDCWLYQENHQFHYEAGNSYWGIVILFSRLSNYYVVGEGRRSWAENSGSSYLPCFEFVDRLEWPATKAACGRVCEVLDEQGLTRLRASQLKDFLSADEAVPTILSDPPWRVFDALFYWED